MQQGQDNGGIELLEAESKSIRWPMNAPPLRGVARYRCGIENGPASTVPMSSVVE
jgi:hypothetical protein